MRLQAPRNTAGSQPSDTTISRRDPAQPRLRTRLELPAALVPACALPRSPVSAPEPAAIAVRRAAAVGGDPPAVTRWQRQRQRRRRQRLSHGVSRPGPPALQLWRDCGRAVCRHTRRRHRGAAAALPRGAWQAAGGAGGAAGDAQRDAAGVRSPAGRHHQRCDAVGQPGRQACAASCKAGAALAAGCAASRRLRRPTRARTPFAPPLAPCLRRQRGRPGVD